MSIVKDILREVFIFLHIDLTKNLKYDRFTREIMKRFLKDDSNCIDVGCHKGEILNMMLQYAPNGKHYAFEPIPYLFEDIKTKYENKAMVFPYALSDNSGETTFNLVKNAPAYSGIKQRRYDVAKPIIEEIKVEMKTLDELISNDVIINFIKIDVEGGEFGVLRGAKNLLKKNKPTILFECGKGASDYYGTDPIDLFNFIAKEAKLEIYTLKAYIKGNPSMTDMEFKAYFNSNEEYYFVAAPTKLS